MNLRNVFAPLIELLQRKQISYAVIGGYAVAAWGELRATRDIDLLCSPKDLGVLKSSLTEAALDFEHRVGDADDPISDVIRVSVGAEEEFYEADILAGIRGAPADLLQRARIIQIGDLEVRVAGPEDVIILKLLGGSALDFEDARGILRIQNQTLDRSLLENICPDFLKGTLSALLAHS
jgi:predicted nucleotidyltransferase